MATRQICWPKVDSVAWRESQGWQGTTGQSRSSSAMAKSTKRVAFGADQPSALQLLWLRFFRDFSSVVRQMPGYLMWSWGMARTPHPQAWQLHLSAWQTSHTSSLWQSQSGLGTQAANQPTNQSFSLPYLVQGNLVPSLWHDQSRPLAWLQNC